MTWLVKVALDRPYTFIVMALMILIFGPLAQAGGRFSRSDFVDDGRVRCFLQLTFAIRHASVVFPTRTTTYVCQKLSRPPAANARWPFSWLHTAGP